MPTTMDVPNFEIHHVESDPHRSRRQLPGRRRGRDDRRARRASRTRSRTRSRRSGVQVREQHLPPVADPRARRGGAGMKTAPFEYHAPRTDRRGARAARRARRRGQGARRRPEPRAAAGDAPGASDAARRHQRGRRAGRHPSDRRHRPAPSARSTRERDAERSPLVRRAAPGAGRGAAVHRPRLDPQPRHHRRQRSRTPTRRPSCPRSRSSPARRWSCVPRSGERVVPADDFFVGHFTTSMADDELLDRGPDPVRARRRGLGVPRDRPSSRRLRPRRRRRHGHARPTAAIGEARIAPDRRRRPRRSARPTAEAALVGQTADAGTIAAAAARRDQDLEPASDIHGSAEFRRHLAGVAVRRALTTAVGACRRSSVSETIEIVVNGERMSARGRRADDARRLPAREARAHRHPPRAASTGSAARAR